MSTEKTQEYDPNDVFDTKTVAEVQKEIDERSSGSYVPQLYLAENQTALVRFLKGAPLKFYQHRVYDPSKNNGQGGYTLLTCLNKNCPLCAAGDKPSFKGAWPIIHIDNVDTDDKGNQVMKPRLKMLVRGIKDLAVLERKAQKHPLTEVNMEVERIGKGTGTQYMFDRTEEKDMPECEYDEGNLDLRKLLAPKVDVLKRLADLKAGVNQGGGQPAGQNQEQPANNQPADNGSSSEEDDDDDIPF